MNFFQRLFRLKPKLTGHEINMWQHTGWGNSIFWLNYERRQIYGHLMDKPQPGDLINSRMDSGKVAQFLVVDVEYMRDPPDMFFCTVSDFGYTDKY